MATDSPRCFEDSNFLRTMSLVGPLNTQPSRILTTVETRSGIVCVRAEDTHLSDSNCHQEKPQHSQSKHRLRPNPLVPVDFNCWKIIVARRELAQ